MVTTANPPLLSGAQWCELLGVRVIDPDGWCIVFDPYDDTTFQTTPITRADFERRFARSTVELVS